MPFLSEEAFSGKKTVKWALLPGLCCQAAGGDPLWVDSLSAAWLSYYVAAHIMDSVEDRDDLILWGQKWETGPILNVAAGLYFTASLLLTELHSREPTVHIAQEIIAEFYQACFLMCGGQHLDLTLNEPSLSGYWNSVNLRSGTFFSMACRLGARVATSDQLQLDGYAGYGRNIGILIQILDDLEEFRVSDNEWGKSSFQVLRRSLPVVYALEVLPLSEGEQLRWELRQAQTNPAIAKTAFRRIENAGAARYIIAENERYRQQAVSSLEAAGSSQPAARELIRYLESLTYQF